jgi:hypothetical protein
MDSTDPELPELARLLTLKRYELPPPGFHSRFRMQVMARIEAERRRMARPWWNRVFAEFNWQRGMAVADAMALAGVACLAVATFHVANTMANEAEEVLVYAPLPLPGNSGDRDSGGSTSNPTLLASSVGGPDYLPRPSSGLIIPPASFTPVPEGAASNPDDHTAPAWLFNVPTMRPRKAEPPQFIFHR